jgi:hypothetical protein
VTLGGFPPPCSVGLPPILTPSTKQAQPCGQRCKVDQLNSPPWSGTPFPPFITCVQPGRPATVSGTPSKLHGSAPQPTQNRPTLTPRSPAFQRPAAYQFFHPPTGTVAALRPPFPTLSYDIEPGTRNFPPSLASHRPTYGYTVLRSERAITPRRRSVGGCNLTRAPSSSGSPSTPYSSSNHAVGSRERQRPVGIPISSASG